MPKLNIPTKTINKSQYKNYLRKADEFISAMRDAYLNENWNAVALNAVHTAVSANDAFCTYYYGVRCVSPKHADAVKLLISLSEEEETKKNSTHLA